MQSPWISLLEACANVVAGLALSLLLQLALFQAMEIAASLTQNLVLTGAFAALSLIRSYVLRRLFNALLHESVHRMPPPPAGANP